MFNGRRRYPLPFLPILQFSLSVVSLAGWATDTRAQESAADLIKLLHENEALYGNMEVSWVNTVSQGRMKYSNDKMLAHREERGRYVKQNGKYYLDFTRDQQSVGNTSNELKHWGVRSAFDGGFTSCLEDNAGLTGNSVVGLRDDCHKFLPHTICLSVQYRHQLVPLSVWLSGPDAIAATNGKSSNVDSRYVRSVTYSGREIVDGLTCHKLTVEFATRGQNPSRIVSNLIMWLAEERNCLPVQTKHFSFGVSTEIPVSETTMSDLRELEPGVWFPFHGRMTAYDKPAMEEDGDHVVAFTEEFVVSEASLNPRYEKAFFQVSFPDGTPIYKVEDDKVISSHVQGGVPLPTASRRSGWWAVVIVFNALFFLVLVAAMFIRSRRTAVEK